MKKILSILLSGTLLVSGMSTVFGATKFTDFNDKSHWAYNDVKDMVSKGYINGYEDNTFKPDAGVTRLEVLALFSRAIGAVNEENAEIVNLAVNEYEDVLSKFALPWGKEEISFLLYRDVLTVDDLTTYLGGKLKNEPMPRYEAAIIITKAMGGAKTATSTQAVKLDFTDQRSIPQNALQYVKYVSDNGIMKGMDGGLFSPESSVVRAQMAVMLSRVVDKMDLSVVSGKLTSVDTEGKTLTLKTADGDASKYNYTDGVIMSVEGEHLKPSKMTVGVSAVLTLSGKRAIYVDALSSIPDETVKGVFHAKATSSKTTKITIRDSKTNELKSYECSPSLAVTYNGEPSTLANFKLNDYVTIEVSGGKAETIIGETKEVIVAGATVEEISVDPDFKMTISHAKDEYDGVSYEISQDVIVNKNNKGAEFSDIYVGDKVDLTIVYGVITGIKATSSVKSYEGTIKSIVISSTPSIIVNIKGEEKTFAVVNDAEILVNGEEGALYDFRVGDIVKVTVESQTVTKISTTSAQSSNGKIEGVITAVNTAIGFIKVAYTNEDDYTVEETVYCKDSSTTILNEVGQGKKVKDLAEGQNVTVRGTISSGAFTANIIIFSE